MYTNWYLVKVKNVLNSRGFVRQIGAFESSELATKFVGFLKQKHITALIEEDQGSFVVWVHDEGHIKRAKNIYDEMEKESFKSLSSFEAPPPPLPPSSDVPPDINKKREPKKLVFSPIVTNILLFLCTFVYVFGLFQEYREKEKFPGVLGISKLGTALLIDYPESFVIAKELMERYGVKNVVDSTLPQEAEPMIKELNALVPWVGIYHIFLSKAKDRDSLFDAKLFGDVRKGEVWRLFTPAIYHRELLHFLFNMLWLMVLGKMVEFNTGRVKFSLLVVLAAVVANVSQYFISGPVFMGFSGVVTAFIGYVWVRKKRAPWEMYNLQGGVMVFLLVYIFGLFGLQGIFFALQYFNVYSIPFHIANTAHVVGFSVGAFLAKTNLLAKSM